MPQYSQEIGQKFAMQRAIDQIWAVEGYFLQKINAMGETPECCGKPVQVEMQFNKSDPT